VNGRVWIDETATSLEPRHRIAEANVLMEGTSTRKGIGQARAERAMRQAPLIAERVDDQLWPSGAVVGNLQSLLRDLNRGGANILIEGTQGYVLGQHAGYYPDCTSWDCRAVDFLAAVGLAPQPVEVWLVARTYPIRIAGGSGPLPNETSWDRLGLEPEITTVTKRVRRVGDWNPEWVKASVEANCAPDQSVKIALTMVDYWYPELRGQSGEAPRDALIGSLGHRLDMMEDELQGQGEVRYLGTGPQSGIALYP
jgi:adenylosuccinate synthase